MPVREAIHRILKAEDDDVLLDEDVTSAAGRSARFSAGFIGSVVNAKVRAYYVVKDELRTETGGPRRAAQGGDGEGRVRVEARDAAGAYRDLRARAQT